MLLQQDSRMDGIARLLCSVLIAVTWLWTENNGGVKAEYYIVPANQYAEVNTPRILFSCGGSSNMTTYKFAVIGKGNNLLIGSCVYISPGVTRCDHNRKFYIIKHMAKQFDLVIHNPTYEDAGEYICMDGSTGFSAILVVVSPPRCGLRRKVGRNRAIVFCGATYGSFIPIDLKLHLAGARNEQPGKIVKSVDYFELEKEFEIVADGNPQRTYVCELVIPWPRTQEDVSTILYKQYYRTCQITL